MSFTSSNQKVPLISGLPGTPISLIAISCVCGPATKSASSSGPTARAQQVFSARQYLIAIIILHHDPGAAGADDVFRLNKGVLKRYRTFGCTGTY